MSDNGISRFVSSIPPVTKNLIIINLIIWVAEALFPKAGDAIVNLLGLHFITASKFNPVQLVTYLFVHDPSTPAHVLFNMFSLWMFGSTLERVWGSKRYFVFYFVCGIGAALVQELVWSLTWMNEFVDALARANQITAANMKSIVETSMTQGDLALSNSIAGFKNMFVTIGASGAVFGILLGYAFVFPNQPLYLFFIPVPIKAKYMMIGYGVIEFFLGVAANDMVAHFAHLGGMLFGLILLLYWKKKGLLGSGFFY